MALRSGAGRCQGPAGPSDDSGDTAAEAEPCGARVEGSTPDDGETDVFWLDSVQFELSGTDPSASITLADADGKPVAGWTLVSADLVGR